eukprot:Skav225270  [mRNA]  locus=scaffold4099:132079:132900:+ [translate_table: standard]
MDACQVSVVGQTAFMDALFRDPYAKALSGHGLEMSDRLGEAASHFGFDDWPEFHKVLSVELVQVKVKVWTVVRTKFIDDTLSAVNDVRQMVNLGAGVDTRPFRLDAYQRFKASFEVDTEEVSAA